MAKYEKDLALGGQAVIEGILMRSKDRLSVAVRKPNSKIVIKEDPYLPLSKRIRFLGLPVIRGIISFFEMLAIGMKALTFSANEQLEEEEIDGGEKKEIGAFTLTLTVAFSLIIGLGMFVLLPYCLTNLARLQEQTRPVMFNIVDGIIKLAILVTYLFAISRLKDIKRIFEYHGAEHKTIHCYENKKKLTIENVKCFPKAHPRCGSSFLLFVVIIGIFVFSFIPLIAQYFINLDALGNIARYATLFSMRLALLPVIAGISYEALKLSGKYRDNWFFKIFSKPGLMLQSITTREPDGEQIEVAISALNSALGKETEAATMVLATKNS